MILNALERLKRRSKGDFKGRPYEAFTELGKRVGIQSRGNDKRNHNTMQIIVHIGQQKTASTTIQNQLLHNRMRLASQGVLFPMSLGIHKSKMLKRISSNDRDDIDNINTILKNLSSEISDSTDRMILSEEELFYPPNEATLEQIQRNKENPKRIKKLLGHYATSWRIICYVRRPDEHFPSLYQQYIKSGYALTFNDALAYRLVSDYYYYSRHIEQWAQVFGENSVEVRLFHRNTLNGSPSEDFAQWLGLDLEVTSSEGKDRANESFDRLNTEILRFLNLCRSEQPDLLLQYDLRQIRPRLRALDTGERLRLDTVNANRLHEQFREDHERLADRYLSPEHAAVLLAPPAEVPPQPPLDRQALFERMMALFSDPTLARLAVDKVDHSVARNPGSNLQPDKESALSGIIEKFNRKSERLKRRSERIKQRTAKVGSPEGLDRNS